MEHHYRDYPQKEMSFWQVLSFQIPIIFQIWWFDISNLEYLIQQNS